MNTGMGMVSVLVPRHAWSDVPSNTTVPASDGQGLVYTFGVLIPDGYQLSTAIPGHPWACPLRSCQNVFESKRSLGAHFTVSCLFTSHDSSLSM